MAISELRSSYVLHWETASGAKVHGGNAQPDRFNFLSFLATAQALGIEFLHIVWDTARGIVGTGGTSRIHQALLNVETSFAFKTYHKRDQTEEEVFRTLITEITVLSQPFVHEHPNIAQLQGICWDISPNDDKPWPVLVFEKSHLGDLYHFARHGGRDMTIHERLGLCVDIGRAVMDMHSNRIVHGDIKPENVLVFSDRAGRHSARVTDFGYSTRYFHKSQQLILPRSEPWNAPENDGRRGWLPPDALKADLFCFGMLAFWLLFETSLSGIIPPRNPEVMDTGVDNSHKTKRDIQQYAQRLLISETALEDAEKVALRAFFQSSLSPVPEQREMKCLQTFLQKLDPQWTSTLGTVPIEKDENIDFKIQKSIYEFYRTDYRVRSYVAQCLLNSYSQSAHIAIQAALCLYIGFGITRDEIKAKEILGSSQNIKTMQEIISSLHLKESEYFKIRAYTTSNLNIMGVVRWSDFTDIYLEQERLNEAEARLIQEKDDLVILFGIDHALVGVVKNMLSRIYSIKGHWDDAEKLEVEVMETSKQKLGADHPSTLTSMANLASTFWNQGRWDDAEKLEVEVVKTSKQKLGTDHPSTLTSMANLASTYRNQGRWDDAEKLFMEVMETRKQKLGADHPSTTYRDQGRWDDAEKLEVEVMETSKQKLGVDHPSTLTSMHNLAFTWKEQGRYEEAISLMQECVQRHRNILGTHHPAYISALQTLDDWGQAHTVVGGVGPC